MNDAAVFIGDSQLLAVKQVFEENFNSEGEIGASVSIWQHGEEILKLSGGFCQNDTQTPWTDRTLIPLYSATKGPASATLLLALEKHGYCISDLVTSVWKNFPNPSATFAQLLSHQCGLSAIDRKVSVFEYSEVISAIEAQQPCWQLGDGHGYHPRTFGFLLDQICLQLEGEKIGSLFNKWIAEPLDLEVWIGLPEEYHSRVATLYKGRLRKGEKLPSFYKELGTADTLVQRSFSSPVGLNTVEEMNTAKAWKAGLPAMGGFGTATSLAKFYQAAIGEIPLFSQHLLQWMRDPIISGLDKTLCTPTSFSCGFQLDPTDAFGEKIRSNNGPSSNAFGHPGAGGSHAFGDPDLGISFAYIMNQMELSVLPNPKSINMVKALYEV